MLFLALLFQMNRRTLRACPTLLKECSLPCCPFVLLERAFVLMLFQDCFEARVLFKMRAVSSVRRIVLELC